MTCVVACVRDGKVYMGSDSAAASDTEISTQIRPKVFSNGDFLIGYCHSFRLGQIVEYHFKPPKIISDSDEHDFLIKFMVKHFIPALRACLTENCYPSLLDEANGWSLIVGVRGNIFIIEDDFNVSSYDRDYHAIGSGSPYALGALEALSTDEDMHPLDYLNLALMAAEKHSPSVASPFHFESS